MTSMAFMMRFYNNAAKIFGAEDVLCRRLEIFEWKVVYEACGSCYVISTSAWVYFFEKSFRVPKVVPKICIGTKTLTNKSKFRGIGSSVVRLLVCAV